MIVTTPRLSIALLTALALAPGCIIVTDDVASASDSSSTSEGGTSMGTETTGGSMSSTSEGTSTEGTATEGTSTAGTTTEGTTTAGTTTEGTTTAGTSDGTTTGGELCTPPQGIEFDFALDPAPEEFLDLEFTYLCEIVSLSVMGSTVTVETKCTDGDEIVDPSPAVVVTADPSTSLAGLAPGMTVNLIYGQYAPWWTERWIRIETAVGNQLLLAAAVGSALGSQAGADLYAPTSIAVGDGVCGPEEDFCGAVERLGLEISAGGEPPALVLDDQFAIVGGDPGLSTWVVRASGYVGEIQCTDTPSHWYTVAMVLDGME